MPDPTTFPEQQSMMPPPSPEQAELSHEADRFVGKKEWESRADEMLERMADEQGLTDDGQTPQHGTPAKPTDGQPRDDTGKFASKKAKEAAGEDTTETPDAGGEQPEAPEATEPTPEPEQSGETPDTGKQAIEPEQYRKALKHLQLDGVPSDLLERLEPQEIIDWGNRVERKHRKYSTKLQEAAEGRKQQAGEQPESPDNQTAQPVQQPEPQGQPAEPQAPSVDFDALLQPLADDLGDDVVPHLRNALKGVHDQLQAQNQKVLDEYQSRFSRQQQALEAMQGRFEDFQGQVIERQFDAAREKLWERFPQLKDTARYQEAHDLALDLARTGRYEEPGEALHAACLQAFAAERLAELEADRAVKHKQRSNGQVTTPSRTRRAPEPMTGDQRIDKIMGALADGDYDAASRAARRPKK